MTHLESAKATLSIELQALQALPQQLNADFERLVNTIGRLQGHVVVMGLGKSGHIGRKICASLASTGTPAFFVHPSEAGHGDMGMITTRDLVLALSNSGEQDELNLILPLIRRSGIAIACITANPDSSLAKLSDYVLQATAAQEACPNNLAPTSSTLLQLALGDALTVACLRARNFSRTDFAKSHPSGALGRRLCTRVQDIMTQSPLPIVPSDMPIIEAMRTMSDCGLGLVVCVNAAHEAQGIFTDGDLRRTLLRGVPVLTTPVHEVMHTSPVCIRQEAMAVEALTLMETNKVGAVVATHDDGRLAGIVNMHALLRAKII